MQRLGYEIEQPARAEVKIGLAKLAYNARRLVWLGGLTVPA
jgi:hypothetical protein